MEFEEKDLESYKKMFLHAIKLKDEISGGHNGFKLSELQPVLDELEKEGKIEIRPTFSTNITTNLYFLKK